MRLPRAPAPGSVGSPHDRVRHGGVGRGPGRHTRGIRAEQVGVGMTIAAACGTVDNVRAGQALLEVPANRSSKSGTGSVHASGLLLAGCGAAHALAPGRPAWHAAVVLLAGGAVHVLGEPRHGAGSWAQASALAPERAHGQYQGVHNMSTGLGGTRTPALRSSPVADAGPATPVRAGTGSEVAG